MSQELALGGPYLLISFSFHFLSQDFLPDKSFRFGFPTAQPKSDECQAYRQKKNEHTEHTVRN